MPSSDVVILAIFVAVTAGWAIVGILGLNLYRRLK